MPRLKKRKIVKHDLPLYPDLFDFPIDTDIEPIIPIQLIPIDSPSELPHIVQEDEIYVFDEEELNKKLKILKTRAEEREKQLESYTHLINLLIAMNK